MLRYLIVTVALVLVGLGCGRDSTALVQQILDSTPSPLALGARDVDVEETLRNELEMIVQIDPHAVLYAELYFNQPVSPIELTNAFSPKSIKPVGTRGVSIIYGDGTSHISADSQDWETLWQFAYAELVKNDDGLITQFGNPEDSAQIIGIGVIGTSGDLLAVWNQYAFIRAISSRAFAENIDHVPPAITVPPGVDF